jgi:hypothetical protein
MFSVRIHTLTCVIRWVLALAVFSLFSIPTFLTYLDTGSTMEPNLLRGPSRLHGAWVTFREGADVVMALRRLCLELGGLVTRGCLVAKVFLPSSWCEGISSLLCIPSWSVCSISVDSFYPECFSAQLAPPDRFGSASRGLLGTPGPDGYCFVCLRHLG